MDACFFLPGVFNTRPQVAITIEWFYAFTKRQERTE